MFVVNNYTVVEAPREAEDIERINSAIDVLKEIDEGIKGCNPATWEDNSVFRDAAEALEMIKEGNWMY